MQTVITVVITLILLTSNWAVADTIYKCIKRDDNTTIFLNQQSYSKDNKYKDCVIMQQDKPVSTFSAPAPKPKQATPADFPRVNGDQQKARDNDRRAILEKELANEQKNLAAAKKELAEQENLVAPDERIAGGGIQGAKREARIQTYRDKVQLHERNLESLRKELANLK